MTQLLHRCGGNGRSTLPIPHQSHFHPEPAWSTENCQPTPFQGGRRCRCSPDACTTFRCRPPGPAPRNTT
ncbi:hypothetical protein, partial [Enterobacter hormaechei]|uniref:hypothetical protein n=1 Tax=Enterobacter hormaechei TaxID=158836 RepID=UPI00203EC864